MFYTVICSNLFRSHKKMIFLGIILFLKYFIFIDQDRREC